MELVEKLKWRYATKAMNGQKISKEKIYAIIEAISLAPTSSGLQPFEVFVITNDKVKEKIKPIAWNQSVITDCEICFDDFKSKLKNQLKLFRFLKSL